MLCGSLWKGPFFFSIEATRKDGHAVNEIELFAFSAVAFLPLPLPVHTHTQWGLQATCPKRGHTVLCK